MKKITNKGVIATLLIVLIIGCVEDFDDPTMAQLKKPEILSIVIEPPEAAPGQEVVASFLMADENGPIIGNANIWLPSMGIGDEGTEMMEQLAEMGLTFEDLVHDSLHFTIPDEEEINFDDEGFAAISLLLSAAKGDDPDPQTSAIELLEQMETLSKNGLMKEAIRTVVVSNKEALNKNPIITQITSGEEEQQGGSLIIARSNDENLATSRPEAKDNPLVIKEKTTIFFEAKVEDEAEDKILYQWISTGGDFEGLRKKNQPWTAPKYEESEDNLHSVWLIVRDNENETNLGQAWAEFYVQVTL